MTKQLFFFFLCSVIAASAVQSITDFEQAQTGNWYRQRRRSFQYPPPGREDVTFVETSSGDLGEIHFRSDGSIEIPFRIDRFFGDQYERNRQLEIGALPENVHLYLPAWDVDFSGAEGYCNPERDLVLFNNHSLGFLNGADVIWQMNIFNIPLDIVHLPEAPGEKAENLIQIYVDTANTGKDYWCTAIDWAALLIPAPRPLLLVHGWWSSAATWQRMQQQIREMYGVPACAVEVGPQDSIESNARRLRQILEGEGGLKKAWGVDQFNILAHSKGGLDSRWYTNTICNPDFCGDIHQVLQIATPNRGSRMASFLFDSSSLPWHEQEILSAVGFWVNLKTPGTNCLTPEYCRLMEELCPEAAAAAQVKVVTGRVPDQHLGIFGVDLFPVAARAYGHCDASSSSEQWGDGVVAVASAHAKVSPKTGSPLHGKGYDHLGIIDTRALESARIYRQEITERKYPKYSSARLFGGLTYRRAPAKRNGEQPAAPATPPKQDSLEWEEVRQSASGIIAAGQQIQQQFVFGQPQPRKFLFFGMPPGILIRVQMPGGKVFSSDQPGSGFQFAELTEQQEVPMKSLLAGTVLLELPPDSKEGLCTVTLTAAELSAETGWQIWLNEEKSAFTFQCWMEKEKVAVGEEFRIFCRARCQEELLHAAAMSADLLVDFIGEEKVESFSAGAFRDDGLAPDVTAADRVFTAAFLCPKRGDYRFTALARLHPDGAVQVEAKAWAAGQGSRSGGRVSACSRIEAFDLNQNRLYDELQVTCQLEISEPGKYSLSAKLLDAEQEMISLVSSRQQPLMAGNREIVLHFPGEKIFAHGVAGPWQISGVHLLEWAEDGTAPVLLDKVAWTAETAPFSHLEFEHDPVLLTGEGVDCGIDSDGDGVLDHLHVELDLLLAPGLRGYFQWSGTLFDENNHAVAVANANSYLEEAPEGKEPAQLFFDFPGEAIAAARSSGVFHPGGISFWGGGLPFSIFLPVDYQTAAYSARSFIKNLKIVEVTSQITMNYGNWRVNPEDGSLQTSITMNNVSGKNGQPMELVFWLVLPASEHARLVQIDGKTPDGKDYMDVTAAVESALRQTGNRDLKFDPGESVQFAAAVFSRDRTIPAAELFSFWADPPAEPAISPDRDGDRLIDDLEVLQAVEEWHQGKLTDQALLDVIECWQTGKPAGEPQ